MSGDAIYCFDRACVLFAIYPEGKAGPRVVAEISEDALRDEFGAQGGGDSLVDACRSHFDVIEAVALRRYREDPVKAVLVEVGDFAFPAFPSIDSVS